MRLSILRRIMEIEEGVIRRGIMNEWRCQGITRRFRKPSHMTAGFLLKNSENYELKPKFKL